MRSLSDIKYLTDKQKINELRKIATRTAIAFGRLNAAVHHAAPPGEDIEELAAALDELDKKIRGLRIFINASYARASTKED